MDEVKTKFLKSQKSQACLWFCWINEIFFTWNNADEKLTQFLNELNNFHPNFDCNFNYVYPNVRLRNGAIHTNLKIKPTADHQHLNYHSSHMLHIKASIPYNQALKVSRTCSQQFFFETRVFHMKEWFLNKGLSRKSYQ